MIHSFIIISLLCAAHSSESNSTNYTGLPNDVKAHISEHLSDTDRIQARLINREHKTAIDDNYNKEINDIKSIIFDGKNVSEKVNKLRNIFTDRKHLFFRQQFDKELPQIFKTTNFSFEQSRLLLHAMNKGHYFIFSHYSYFAASLSQMLEYTSHMLLLHYIHFHRNSTIRKPFVYIVGAIYYQMFIKTKNYTLTENTIVWDSNTTHMIMEEVIQKDSGIIPIQFDVACRLFDSNRPCYQQFNNPNLMYNTFMTNFIRQLSNIHDDKNNNLQFTILNVGEDVCMDWRCRHWIELISSVALYQYHAGDMDSFNTLIHSLATIFYARNSIQIIYEMTERNTIVIKKLIPLRRLDWNRHSLFSWMGISGFCAIWFGLTIFVTDISLVLIILIWTYWCTGDPTGDRYR
eukprot:540187_1